MFLETFLVDFLRFENILPNDLGGPVLSQLVDVTSFSNFYAEAAKR